MIQNLKGKQLFQRSRQWNKMQLGNHDPAVWHVSVTCDQCSAPGWVECEQLMPEPESAYIPCNWDLRTLSPSLHWLQPVLQTV